MRVRCVNNSGYVFSLTEGYVYNVLREDDEQYYVLNDENEEFGYLKIRFEIV